MPGMSYTATARRSGQWWVIQCDQHPGALSQITCLDQAAEVHREAIALITGEPKNGVEVAVRPELHPRAGSQPVETHRHTLFCRGG